MTATITPARWIQAIRREYLESFVREGGAAIKFCVPLDGEARAATWNWLSQAGQELGYAVVKVDASETKVNLVDKLFFSIAAQIDWPGLSERVLKRLCEQTGYLLPEASEMSFCERVAERNRISADIVKINLEQALGEEVLRRRDLAKDFRMAMTRLCLARLRGGADAPITIRALTEWLTGRNLNVSAVKQHQIFNRITRTNARRLLESLIHWVRLAGFPGTLVLLDVARLAVARNPRDDRPFYNNAMLLDAFEVLRELVDSTDWLTQCLIAVLPDSSFLDETSGRGIASYQALELRIKDDVRTKEVVNPMAALVRLSTNAPEAY